QVGQRIVGELRERGRGVRELRGSKQDRVTVGRAFRYVVVTDRRGRADVRVDDDLLFPAFHEMGQEDAPGEVVTAARRERDDNARGLARKLLGENGGGRQQR